MTLSISSSIENEFIEFIFVENSEISVKLTVTLPIFCKLFFKIFTNILGVGVGDAVQLQRCVSQEGEWGKVAGRPSSI